MKARTRRSPLFLPLLAAVLLGAFWAGAACRSLVPARASSARAGRDVPILDQAKYKQSQQLVTKGNEAFVRGQYAQAQRLALQSLAAHESFGGYYLNGSSLFRLGRNQESLDAFYKAENIRPADEQLLLTIAVVELSRGDVQRALDRYVRLHEGHPKDPTYAFKVGTTHKLLGQYEKAYEFLKLADQADFAHLAQVCVQLGDTALELKKYEESEAYFKRAHKLDPSLKAAGAGTKATAVARILDQGNSAFKAGRFDEALGHFNRAKTDAPRSAGPYLLAGTTLLAMKKYAEAAAELEKAINLNAGNARGYSLLGSAYHQAGRYRDAQRALRLGLKVAPESHELYNKLGLVLKDNGQLRGGIDSFAQAVRLKADYVPARVNLAFALLDDKRFAEADQQFQEAVRLKPDDKALAEGRALVRVFSLVDTGDRLFQQGALDRAGKAYREALELRKAAVVYNALGNLELARKKNSAAIGHFQEARRVEPKNVAALQGLLRAYSGRKDAKKRAAILSELRKLSGNDVEVGVSLGRLREDENKFAEAESIYRALLKQNPESDLVKRRLGYVYYRMGLADNDAQQFGRALERLNLAGQYNADIPQLPDSIRTVQENLKFKDQLPLLKKAEALFDARNYAQALPMYERVYSKLRRALVLVRIANCHIALGRESRGLRLLEEGQRGPDVDVAISEAIYTYLLKKGRTEEAARGFAQIVRSRPDAYFSHYKLGIIDLLAGRQDEALENFNRAVNFQPEFTAAYIGRGVVHYRKGDAAEARREFELALKREPKSPLAAFNLGVMSFNDNLAEKAEQAFKEIAAATPEFTDARYHLSYIYFARGDLDRALSELQACIQVEPQPRYRFALAQVYEKRYAGARTPANAVALRATYQALISDFPGSAYAAESRDKLRRLNPDTRVLHAYPEKSAREPVLTNGVLVRVVGNDVVGFDATAKSRLWSREFPEGVSDLHAAGALFVASGKRLTLLNHRSGGVLAEYELSSSVTRALGDYGQPAVVVRDGAGGTPSLVTWPSGGATARHQGRAGSQYFYEAGRFYHLGAGAAGTMHLERLKVDLSVDGAPIALGKAKGRAELLVVEAREYVFFPGRALFVVEEKEVRPIRVARHERRLLLTGGNVPPPLLVGRSGARALKPNGDTAATFRFQVPVADPGSAIAPAADRLLYHGTDGKLHLVELRAGQVRAIWDQELGALEPGAGTRGRAFSIYY